MASFSRHIRWAAIITLIAIAAAAGVMYYTGHLAAYLTTDQWPKLLILVVVGLLAGIFPDIDIASRSQRYIYILLLAIDLILIWQRDYRSAALLGLFGLIPPIGKHRGWTHTWMVPAVVFFILPPLYQMEIQPFLIVCYFVAVSGYITHLVVDGYIGKSARQVADVVKRK